MITTLAICADECGQCDECVSPDNCTCIEGWTGNDCCDGNNYPIGLVYWIVVDKMYRYQRVPRQQWWLWADLL